MKTSGLGAALLAGAVLVTGPATALPSAGIGADSVADVSVVHDFHVSYTRMAIEPTVISAQIRLFTDDLTRLLLERAKRQAITLNSTEGEAAFAAYLAQAFPVTANGRRLVPVVVSGAQDKEMWSYIVTWTSPVPITALSMHNAALFELFGDQQNIVKVKHMSSGKESTLFYSGGSRADQVVRF
ncbi:MAG: DUF6702 family protein [Gemmatimonadota bacterium]